MMSIVKIENASTSKESHVIRNNGVVNNIIELKNRIIKKTSYDKHNWLIGYLDDNLIYQTIIICDNQYKEELIDMNDPYFTNAWVWLKEHCSESDYKRTKNYNYRLIKITIKTPNGTILTGYRSDTAHVKTIGVLYDIPINQELLNYVINYMTPNRSTIEDLIKSYNEIAKYYIKARNNGLYGSDLILYSKDKFNMEKMRLQQSYATTATTKFLRSHTDISEQVKAFMFKISQPVFRRDPGNTNRKTFDSIHVEISIPSKTKMPNRVEFIKKHKREIAVLALRKIEQSKQFERYDIPINFLQLKSIKILPADEITIMFTLKDLTSLPEKDSDEEKCPYQ